MDQPAAADVAPASGPPWTERLLAFFEVCGCALLGGAMAQLTLTLLGVEVSRVFQDSVALFTFLVAESVFTLALIGLFLKARGQTLRSLSPRRRRLGRETLIGLAGLPVVFALLLAVTIFFAVLLPDWVSQTNPVLDLIRTPRDLVLFLLSSLFVGGVKEEIQRAFVLDRFERFLGGAGLGLGVWSLFFGIGHLAQGPDNAVKAAGLGLAFGLLYLRRRHLAAPIVCHAAFDVVVVAAYWFAVR